MEGNLRSLEEQFTRDLVLTLRECFGSLGAVWIQRAHLDSMGTMYEAVEDAVGKRGVACLFVPARDTGCEVKIVSAPYSDRCRSPRSRAVRFGLPSHPTVVQPTGSHIMRSAVRTLQCF